MNQAKLAWRPRENFMTKKKIIVPYLSVTQPIGTFYLAKLSAGELLDNVDILRRGLTQEEQQNVQRNLNDKRQREIAQYVTDPDATFPTSIIVSVYEESVTVDEINKKLTFEFEDKLGEVLDGQHRFEGLRLAISEDSHGNLRNFELPIVFMIELSPDDKAYVFSVINSKQTQVPSSLIFDLFGLQTSRNPKKTCHEIAQTLNAKKGSPFYRGLKMLGNKHYDTEYLTQGAFAKYLLKLISKTPDEDARMEKLNRPLLPDPSIPFRQLYINKEDPVIAKVMENYFGAIAEIFPEEWANNPKEYLLRKTAGYSALITVLNEIWKDEIAAKNSAKREVFLIIAQKMKDGLKGKPITSQNFGSSEQGAKALANAFLSGMKNVPISSTS